MKRTLLKIIGIILLIYIVTMIYISSNAKKEFESYIDSMNRLTPSIKTKISSFEGGITGAKTTVRTEIIDPMLKKQVEQILKLPINTDMELKFGPLILLSNHLYLGAVGTQKSMLISSLIRDNAIKDYKSAFPDDIKVDMQTIISLTSKAKEYIDVDIKRMVDNQEGIEYDLTPLKISRDYDLFSLLGINRLYIKNLAIKELSSNKTLATVDGISATFKLKSISDGGLIYGDYTIGADSIDIVLDTPNGMQSIKFSTRGEISLSQADMEFADLRVAGRVKALDNRTKSITMGIESTQTEIRLQNLGSKGLEELIELQKKRMENQRLLVIATESGDAQLLGRALANMAKLDNGFVPVINHTLIKGKSKIDIKEEFSTDKDSYIHLNATYMGDPLKGDIMNAFVMLASRADRLFNAHLDLKIEKSLAKKLYPQASWILDAMVDKGMAKLENGYYILKADMQDGKIIINSTKYAPQEFLMLILM